MPGLLSGSKALVDIWLWISLKKSCFVPIFQTVKNFSNKDISLKHGFAAELQQLSKNYYPSVCYHMPLYQVFFLTWATVPSNYPLCCISTTGNVIQVLFHNALPILEAT